VTSPEPAIDPAPGSPRPRLAATWPGRPAARPAGAYDPDPLVREAAAGVEVSFAGEDGRSRTFSFAGLPLPGWHADLAGAFAGLTGPTGGLRTLASAENVWQVLGRLARFLDGLAHPPRDVTRLTVRHLRRFELHRRRTCKPPIAARELRALRQLLGGSTLRDRLEPEVVDWLGQRWRHDPPSGTPSYSDQEFRRIMAAARHDVAAIRDRIRSSERLLAHAAAAPEVLTRTERGAVARLQEMAETGQVSSIRLPGRAATAFKAMVKLAGQLFLVDADLAPLLVLGVGITGRNGETLKELPAHHEVLEGRAVVVELTKRRRGPNNICEVVHWEVGAPSRQLHTSGGYYLLVHELARRGRALSGGEGQAVWSIWTVHRGHISPFAKKLDRHLYLGRWVRAHDLRGDDGQPLELTLNRLRTTVEVRTTKAVGGHLPTSARSNSMDVQFVHYLRGDPTVQEWAADEVGVAVVDAERHARQAHLRVLAGSVEQHAEDQAATADQLGVDPETARQALAGELDTLVAACLDINDSPFNEGRCRASFLTCLQCPNGLVTHRHLPGLLALLKQLDAERQASDADTWWARHGSTWLAITKGVLPRFTPAELEQAQAETAAQTATHGVSLLDLLHGPREPS
jgi:hypothetical protein